MPLQSSGIIVVEKPTSASVCVNQQQKQQLLFATTTSTAAAAQKPVAELQYCEYYETNDANAQQQQHAVVVEHSNNSTHQQQQQQIMRRQQQRSNSLTSATSIQQFNLKQQQHMVHHSQQQQQHVVQQQQQVIQVSEELYEQAAAAAGNMMISATGEMLNQQYFKIVTPDGSTGNMIIGPMGNVTTTSGQNSAATGNNSKVLLSNVTLLSKQGTSCAASAASQQQPQTINFVSTKNMSYLTTTTSAATTAGNSKQQKLATAMSGYKTSSKQQHHLMNNTTTTTTTTYIQQPAQQQQQHIVQKLSVPRNVQMVARVQNLMPQTHQQQPHMVMQHNQQPQLPQKYVVPSATKASNALKKSSSMKISQHKMHNNINQSSSVKTFIQQQQSSGIQQQQPNSQYQTTNKMKSQKLVKQYNNAINNSTGAVSIATLPQQSSHTALATYTINQKLNNHQQQSTKITKLANNKYVMHNNQQQQHHVMAANTTATLPHGTQIHSKSLSQQQHIAGNNSNNIMLQQQQLLTTGTHANGNAGTIKFVNAHGTVIQQQHHHQQAPQKYQRQQKQQQYSQQLQFVETSVSADNIYQLSTNTAAATSQASSQSLISDDIMIVNGTQMTDELSARILQSMAQNSFGNQQRFHQQQHTKSSAASSTTIMPPPQQQIVLQQQHHGSHSTATHHILSPKEYPIYNPVQHQQQQQHPYVQQSNYLATGGTSSSNVSSRQSQSTPGSRSQSMERKLLDTSITKKSSDYFKVNTNEILQSSSYYSPSLSSVSLTMPLIDIIPLPTCPNSNSNSSARAGTVSNITTSSSGNTLDGQTALQLKSASATTSNTNEDDIIGEEVRPVPVNTQDLRLQILHAVLQDHTYANPTPTRFPTELAANCQSMSGATQTLNATPQQNTPSLPAQHWSLGGIGATVLGQNVASATATCPAPVGLSALNTQTLITPGGATTYTLYGQQIPRLQQDDDANSAISNGSRLASGDIDPGEETETAPEAEDDSVTRCICDLTHDDGYMICCDKCSAWQHVDCMGIDRQNIPDEYLCELCQPRQVDKARARSLQLMKRKEQQTQLLLNAQVSATTSGLNAGNLLNSSSDQRLAAAAGGNMLLTGVSGDINAKATGHLLHAGSNNSATNKKGKVLKKTKDGGANKKSKKAEKLAAAAAGLSVTGGKLQRKETKKNTKRKTKNSSESASNSGTAAERHAANLRQWIENYELAVTNHYSPELRARLHAISKQANLLQSITNTENKALKFCGSLDAKASTVPHAGGKILISNLDIAPNCPIFELRGKYMLTTQFKTQNASINMNSPPPSNYLASFKAHKIPGPFIFFYQLPGAELPCIPIIGIDGQMQALPPPTTAAGQHLKGPEICVDTRTYGNEARFVRRSCRPNAEIQHLFEKGTIHLFIVSLSGIRASTEITIRHEPHDLLAIEHKKSSQLVIQPTSTVCACGLTKDCLFGPPLQQMPVAAATLPKSNRKAITLNGSSAAALQLTMGGLGAPGVPLGKKKSQTMNRNRSTSSSGDSNMGLNSPNIALHNNSNNLKNLNMLTASGTTFVSAAAVTSMSNAMHDSGICTSSSSPSVSIPSPSSHIHSPTQQQQCMPLQQTATTAIVHHRTLVVQQTQQQQHQQILAALPTTMLLSPQQLIEQQPQPTLAVVTTAAAQTPLMATMPQAMQQPEAQKDDQLLQHEPQTIYVQLPSNSGPQQHKVLLNEPIVATTNMVPEFSNTLHVPLTLPTVPNENTTIAQSVAQQQQPSPATQTAPMVLQQATCESQLHYDTPMMTCSPMASPQKHTTTTNIATTGTLSSARKNSAKNSSSRTTSFSEDASGATDQQQDCDTTASTQSPSSSNNTTLTSPKEKPKLTRDERKMEAILRAIEKMEKNSQRKQELKQSKRVTKRRPSTNSNSSPTLPNKQRLPEASAEGDASTSAAGGANRFQLKKNQAYTNSRKKKRKSHKKSYNLQSTAAQRKRRKSRTNSNESVEAALGDAIPAAVTTSESESNSLLSPQIQTIAAGVSCSAAYRSSVLEETQLCTSSSVQAEFQPSINDQPSTVITPVKNQNNDVTNAANVDQAAGLLMAFANPNSSTTPPPQEEIQQQPQLVVMTPPSPSPVHNYVLQEDDFKSPNRLQSNARDAPNTASPPQTPPAPVSSACMLLEAAFGPLEQVEDNAEFKYPTPTQTKTKKVLMTNWLNQSDVAVTSTAHANTSPQTMSGIAMGLDSLVQAAMSDYKQEEEVENLSMAAKKVEEFIQQTEYSIPTVDPTIQPSVSSSYQLSVENYHTLTLQEREVPPPPAATTPSVVRNLHLPLQVSTCSNNSSVKKRWLRQAISEETDENSLTPSATSTPTTASPTAYVSGMPPIPNGFTTPLKKRRLVISSKDDQESFSVRTLSTTPSPPVSTIIGEETKPSNVAEYMKSENLKNEYAKGDYSSTKYANNDYAKTEYKKTENKNNESTKNEFDQNAYAKTEYVKKEYALTAYSKSEFSNTDYVKSEYQEMDSTITETPSPSAAANVEFSNPESFDNDVRANLENVDNRDDESEIVDVGNNDELIASCQQHQKIMTVPPAETVVKHECFAPHMSQLPSPMQDLKTEITMEQDDDVDILRSPSPGSQKMVAEDNLVKIEPEDTSGGDDVKIDVEREESMAVDKFEEIMQIKQEHEDSQTDTKTEVTTDAVKSEDDNKKIVYHPEELRNEQHELKADNILTSKAPSEDFITDFKLNSYGDQIQQLKGKAFTQPEEEPVKKKPKLELAQAVEAKSSTKLLVATVASLALSPPPQQLPTDELTNNVGEISAANSSAAVVVSTSTACKTANADSTSCSSSVNRNNLSDDDIQERLHSFHKENILFLQSRNKKNKTSSSVSTSATFKNDTKESESKSSTSSAKQHKTLSSSGSSSSSKKTLKKERSSSSGKNFTKANSTGALNRGTSVCSASVTTTSTSSLHLSSSSSAKKSKTLRKSHSTPTNCNLMLSSSSSSSSPMVAVSTTQTTDREKNRHRSISSSSSLPTITGSKKRQLNFEQELSKDLLICSSKHRNNKDDGNSGNLSFTLSSKKRRESCGGGSLRLDESRHKHKSATLTNSGEYNRKKSHAATAPVFQNSVEQHVTATSAAFESTAALATVTITPITTSDSVDTKVTTKRDALCDATITQTVPIALPVSPVAVSTTVALTAATVTTPPSTCSSSALTNSLPYYNTIYGKLLDNTQPQQHVSVSAISSCETILTSNSMLTASTTTSSLSTTTAISPLLSEYLDTKTKSFNTLGGYVSHTAALFGLNAAPKISTSANNDTDATLSTTDLQIATSLTVSPAVSQIVPKLTTPIKILTKTASHDPRLNPILTAPEPPPAPKRKLSINEYRKRKQQTTGGTDNSSISITNREQASKSTTNNCKTSFAAAFSCDSPPHTNYLSTINKCTLNSPERSFDMINKDIQEKSLNESLLSNSLSSFSNIEMPSCLRFGEEDTSKVQFSAAPTLLEKQQENLCERLKSLKNKQSAADLVTGRLSSIGNEFGLKKDNDLFLNRSSTSDLDNCLEAISSSSNSMTSSRESTPERRFHDKDMHLNNRLYNEKTTTLKKAKSEIISNAVGGGAYHHYSTGGISSGSGSIPSGESANKRNYDLA